METLLKYQQHIVITLDLHEWNYFEVIFQTGSPSLEINEGNFSDVSGIIHRAENGQKYYRETTVRDVVFNMGS